MSTCGGSLRNSPPITMGGVLMFRSERMRRTGARSTASGTSSHMQSWADCITGTHVSSFWKRQGCTAFLTKPIKQEVLLQAIKENSIVAPPSSKEESSRMDTILVRAEPKFADADGHAF